MRRRFLPALARPAIVASLAVAAGVSMLYMLDDNRTRIGNEHTVFRIMLGRPVTVDDEIPQNQRLAAYLDPYLAKGQHVILDTSFAYAPILFSHHPSGFIIQEDRDFRPILDSPDGRFQFIVQNPPQQGQEDVMAALIQPAAAWKLVDQFGSLKLWHFVGQPPAPSP